MPGQTSFEERLRRVNARAGGMAVESGGGGTGQPPQGGGGFGGGRRGSRRAVPVATVLLVLVIGALLLALQGAIAFSRQASDHAAAVMAGDPAPGPFRPGIFAWVLGGDGGAKPADFLPAATEGWRRVTPDDAKAPDAMAALSAGWPVDGVALTEHPGFPRLEQFLALYRTEDMEGYVLSKTRTRAMYLHPDGDFASVGIRVWPETRALGPEDAPEGWIGALAGLEAETANGGEIVETVSLAGFPATNRTKPEGRSLVTRPIGTSPDVPNGVRIAVPLSHRIVLRVDGLARPDRIAELLSALDVAAMREALH